MLRVEVGPTRPSQLRRVADLNDDQAWKEFSARYEPLLRACCARHRLGPEDATDVIQETWLQVARRMGAFVYDPRRSFRGWLWRVCSFVAVSALREREASRAFGLEERDSLAKAALDPAGRDEEVSPWLAMRLRLAEEVQQAVLERVQSHTWRAFWLYDIEMREMADVARELDITIAYGHKARQRVLKMLRAEARRRMDATTEEEPAA